MRSFFVAATLCLPLLAPLAIAQETPPTPPPPPPAPDGSNPDRERRRDREGGPGGRGGFGLPIDRLREELQLTPEQVTQLEALNAEIRERMRAFREEGGGGGTFDPQAMRQRMNQAREEIRGRLEQILTPEQRERMESMRGDFMRGGRGRGAGGPDGAGPPGRDGRGPGMRQRLREEAVRALALSEEESAVVLPLVDTVLETRELLMQDQEQRRQALLTRLRETQDEAELARVLAEFRAARAADRAQVDAAMSQLREVLTVEQEAKLVALNVLD